MANRNNSLDIFFDFGMSRDSPILKLPLKIGEVGSSKLSTHAHKNHRYLSCNANKYTRWTLMFLHVSTIWCLHNSYMTITQKDSSSLRFTFFQGGGSSTCASGPSFSSTDLDSCTASNLKHKILVIYLVWRFQKELPKLTSVYFR